MLLCFAGVSKRWQPDTRNTNAEILRNLATPKNPQVCWLACSPLSWLRFPKGAALMLGSLNAWLTALCACASAEHLRLSGLGILWFSAEALIQATICLCNFWDLYAIKGSDAYKVKVPQSWNLLTRLEYLCRILKYSTPWEPPLRPQGMSLKHPFLLHVSEEKLAS